MANSNSTSCSSTSCSTCDGIVLGARFNQNNTLFTLFGTFGFRIYSTDTCQRCFNSASASQSHGNENGIGYVELLFNSNLTAVVGCGLTASSSPRILTLYNVSSQSVISTLHFISTVLAVRLSEKRCVAVCETKIHVFDLRTLHILHSFDTAHNPRGVCALSSNESSPFLVYPSRDLCGTLTVYDSINLQAITSISAHKSQCGLIELNQAGNMLATCSTSGTLIRVWSIPSGQRLHVFRRGFTPCRVVSMSFSSDSTLLSVASSESSTIHIFTLITEAESKPDESSSLYVSTLQAMNSFASALVAAQPSLSDIIEPQREITRVTLKNGSKPLQCAIISTTSNLGNLYHICIITATHAFIYGISKDGSQCRIEEEHVLTEQPSHQINTKIFEPLQPSPHLDEK